MFLSVERHITGDKQFFTIYSYILAKTPAYPFVAFHDILLTFTVPDSHQVLTTHLIQFYVLYVVYTAESPLTAL